MAFTLLYKFHFYQRVISALVFYKSLTSGIKAQLSIYKPEYTGTSENYLNKQRTQTQILMRLDYTMYVLYRRAVQVALSTSFIFDIHHFKFSFVGFQLDMTFLCAIKPSINQSSCDLMLQT